MYTGSKIGAKDASQLRSFETGDESNIAQSDGMLRLSA